MKAIGNKSLAGLLANAISVVWWLEWISFVSVIGFAISTVIVKRSFAVSIPVTFSPVTVQRIIPASKNLSAGVLSSANGTLYVNMVPSWQHVALLLAGLTILFALVILVTFQLKAIFSSFKRNLPFHERNMARIKNIAFILVGYSIIQWLFEIVLNRTLVANFRWETVHLTYNFNMSALVIGLILIVLAEIFRLGATLENDNKLTI